MVMSKNVLILEMHTEFGGWMGNIMSVNFSNYRKKDDANIAKH